MQVTETLSEGLKREFRVVVPANDLDSKVNTRLDELKDQVRINGFRPGKVPVGHLKRMYGRSVMAEAIEATVRDANAQIITERGFRLAMEPQVKLPTDESAIKAVVEGGADLDYSVAMEVLPKIELADFKDIKLARKAYSPADLEKLNVNLVGGDPYGGFCGLDQSFLWRPFKSSVNHRTFIPNLYHIGASTHPGAGLGGGSGFMLAQALR